jgi:hypothetical protein
LAVVRELITILGTEFDPKGVQEYERGIGRIKDIALEAAGAIGIVFSVEKIGEFIDGLLESGAEIKKIRAQIENVARPMDDVNAAMDRTFDIAQEIGVAYTGVADTFREFLQSSKDAKISQEELLGVTENVFKALKVDRATQEQQDRLFAIINRVDVIGKASPRMIGMLQNTSISSLRLLEQYFKTDEDGLRALAKAGKITFEEFTKALGTVSPDLEAKFAKVPWTVGRAWIYARNQLVLAAAEFLKVTRLSIIFGTALKRLTDLIVNMFKSFFQAIGGLKNAIEVLGIAMALVLGPRMLAYLIDMVAWMWRFTAANWAAVAPWIAMAAAVAAVAIAIQDLVYWIQGKPSLIGTWVGSFKDLKSNFANLDIFAGFRVFDDLMKGDWKKAIADLGIALTNTQAIVLELSATIALVTAAFVGWNLLKFSGIIGAIRGLINAIRGVKTAAVEAEVAVAAVEKGKAGAAVGAGAAGAAGAGATAAKGGRTAGVLGWLGKAWIAYELGKAVIGNLTGPGDATEDQQPQIDEAKRKREEWNKAHPGETPSAFGGLGRATEGGIKWLKDKLSYLTPGMGAAGEYLNPSYGGARVDPKTGLFGTPGGGGLGVQPYVAPGALGPTVPGPTTNNDNKQITFNQSNSVNVQVQDDSGLAARIGKAMGDYAGEMFSGIARDLGRSSPRTEAATQ